MECIQIVITPATVMNHQGNLYPHTDRTHPPCCGVLSIVTGEDKLTDGRTVYCRVNTNV